MPAPANLIDSAAINYGLTREFVGFGAVPF